MSVSISNKRTRVEPFSNSSSSKDKKPNLLTLLECKPLFFCIFRFLLPKEFADQPNIQVAFNKSVTCLQTFHGKVEHLPSLFLIISVFHRVILVCCKASDSVHSFMGWQNNASRQQVKTVYNSFKAQGPEKVLVSLVQNNELEPTFVDFMFTSLFRDSMATFLSRGLESGGYQKPLIITCSLLKLPKYNTEKIIHVAVIILRNIAQYLEKQILKWEDCGECLTDLETSFLEHSFNRKNLINFLKMLETSMTFNEKQRLLLTMVSRAHLGQFINFIYSLLRRGDLEALKSMKNCFPKIYELLHRTFKFDRNTITYNSHGGAIYFDPFDTLLLQNTSEQLDLCGEFLVQSGVGAEFHRIRVLQQAGFVKTAAALSNK